VQRKDTLDIEGLDISSYQTITNANLLYSKSEYIILRAYGSDHSGAGDTTFNARVAQALTYDVLIGSYYFGCPRYFPTDAEAITHAQSEAQQYIDKLYGAFGEGKVGDLTPFLDIEEYTYIPTSTAGYPKTSGMTGAQLIVWVKAFRDYFFAETGRRLGFYSNRYFLQDPSQMAITTQQLTEISDMPLWLAEYDQYYGGSTGNVQPQNLAGWDKWVLWQYSVTADSPDWGISSAGNQVDHNRCSDLSWLLPPPKITNWVISDNHNGTISVTIDQPNIPDYLGTSVYVNGVWRGWIAKANLSDTVTITALTIGQTYNVHLVTEDNYHDFTASDTKQITLTESTTGGNTMPKKTNGLTTESVERFVIDAGAVYVNLFEPEERLLGATRGGSTFAIEQEIKLVEIDSVRGATKGARRVVESNARLTTNLLELSTENLLLAIAGSSATNYTDTTEIPAPVAPTHDEIKRIRNVTDIDYLKNIAIVGKIQGTDRNIICMIYNALADGGFEMAFEDREEAVLEVAFTAHYDPANVEEEPWSIFLPK
jgi:GH25 family lysozyme M1 (1,4-beta-N-acetylmuramidase)